MWRSNLVYYIEKHALWAGYQPEEKGALIIYSSIYGNTESAMSALASMIAEKGVRNIHMYDASSIDVSYLVAECFRYSTIVFAAPTYNAEICPKMEALLLELKAHSFQNRDVAVIENGTWALSAGKKMTELLSQMKNIRIIADNLSIRSSLKECQIDQLEAIASAVADSVRS